MLHSFRSWATSTVPATPALALLFTLGTAAGAAWLPPQTRHALFSPVQNVIAFVRPAPSRAFEATYSPSNSYSAGTLELPPLAPPAQVTTRVSAKVVAATLLTVTSTADFPDAKIGDGVCQTGSMSGANCTLRAAIQEANALTGSDAINFNIPGAGVQTIAPASALPVLTGLVSLNGFSQPGSSANTLDAGNNAVILVRLNGAGAGAGTDGLVLATGSNSCVVMGLSIDGFSGAGVRVQSNSNRINGNTFTANNDGVWIDGGTGNSIGAGLGFGSSTVDQRNLMARNRAAGVRIAPRAGVGGTTNLVANSYIGTDAAGLARGANAAGVVVSGDGNTIGGVANDAKARVVVAGNTSDGVVLLGEGNLVRASFLGVGSNGTTALGNGGDGVQIGASGDGANKNTVGMDRSTALVAQGANLIAFNGTSTSDSGVNVVAGIGNSIAGNSIVSNSGLGIDLLGAGNNDALDADGGANNGQNFPVLTSATTQASSSSVVGTLKSLPNATFRIEFYGSPAADASGFGEGQTFLGAVNNVQTDASGNAGFSLLRFDSLAAGTVVSATAIRTLSGEFSDTSEFSNAVSVAAGNASACSTIVSNTNDTGGGSLGAAIDCANATAGRQTISFAIPGTGTKTIAFGPGVTLPGIETPVDINGYSQPGSSPNTLAVGNNAAIRIEVDGTKGFNVFLSFRAGSETSTLRGISIFGAGSGSAAGAIQLLSSEVTIAGCFIGPNAKGERVPGATDSLQGNFIGLSIGGISFGGSDVLSNDNIVGGASPADRNIISGNSQGLAILAGNNNRILGNYIGTNPQGTVGLNFGGGISTGGGFTGGAGGTGNVIGGTGAGEGNLISGNGGDGLRLTGAKGGTLVQGNRIGTDPTGTFAITNGAEGVRISSPGNTVGGSTSGAGNLISGNGGNGLSLLPSGSFSNPIRATNNTIQGNTIGLNAQRTATLGNGGAGISISDPTSVGNRISDNNIAANATLGIDLINSSSSEVNRVTPNDSSDIDSGPNNNQNFPTLTSVTGTAIAGTLGSRPNTAYRIEFFVSDVADPSGFGESQSFLGALDGVTTAANGTSPTFTFNPGAALPTGRFISATAIAPNGDTSEFSAAVQITENLGACSTVVSGTGDAGTGTLRDAINCSNNSAGRQTISFAIPGAGPHTIAPATQLPAITDAVTIDGTTQPGALANSDATASNANLKVVLSGGGTISSGLTLTRPANASTAGDGSIVRGLVINNFRDAGINIFSNGNTIAGCTLGTDAAGSAALPNGSGVTIGTFASGSEISGGDGDNNIIGGITAADRNLISGNRTAGVVMERGGIGNRVIGNLIGTSASGAADLGNGTYGVALRAGRAVSSVPQGNSVGGPEAGARNVISGNNIGGVTIGDPLGFQLVRLSFGFNSIASANTVQNNVIGLNAAGTLALPNGATPGDAANVSGSGVAINGSSNRVLDNIVSGNAGYGVAVRGSSSSSNLVQGNSIGLNATRTAPLGNTNSGIGIFPSSTPMPQNNVFSQNGIAGNGKLGIDLIANSETPGTVTNNDTGDSDTTNSIPNNGQNFPVITSASPTAITGTLNSRANLPYRVEFFASPAADASGNGEGQTYLGFQDVTTGSDGNTPTFTFTPPATPNIGGQFITATATRLQTPTVGAASMGRGAAAVGDTLVETSEFSVAFQASGGVSACSTVVINTADSGAGSLRAAIDCANTSSGVQTISFNIPGAGVKTIAPLSALPSITKPRTTINGYSQPGASANTLSVGNNAKILIELSGASAGQSSAGLSLSQRDDTAVPQPGDGTVVRGLAINRWSSGSGVSVRTNGNTVAGCFIGTDVTGTIARGNGVSGVEISLRSSNTGIFANSNTIGGAAPGDRNIISGNGTNSSNTGVVILNGGSDNTIQNNTIGLDATGTKALGNSGSGIRLYSVEGDERNNSVVGNLISGNGKDGVTLEGSSVSNNTVQGNSIGTNAAGTLAIANAQTGINLINTPSNTVLGNVISGNRFYGVFVTGAGAGDNRISGNIVGRNAANTGPLGNGSTGVRLEASAAGTTIGGGFAPGNANTIAHNGGAGVAIIFGGGQLCIRKGISENSIFSNAGLGIDLENDGATLNDAGDADTGANGHQNFPILNPVTGNTISGSLNSKASGNYRIELFASDAADASGYGEGQRFIGEADVTTNAAGNATFSVALPSAVPAGQFVSATATDQDNNTSEFSLAVVSASSACSLVVSNTNDSGAGSLRAAIDCSNTSSGVQTISFAIAGSGVKTIAPTSPLPALTGAAVLDGNTQPGATANTLVTGALNAKPLIEISGQNAGTAANGLVLTAPGTTVRGLVFNRFLNGIVVNGAANTKVEGCFIGTNAAGSAALPNRSSGVFLDEATSSHIGGSTPVARNLISGNSGVGVTLTDGSNSNFIQGNLIGTDATGLKPLGNGLNGIVLNVSGANFIGGEQTGLGNVVAANGFANSLNSAIYLLNAPAGVASNTIQGNIVGLNVRGDAAMGNNGIGVDLFNSNGTLVGGATVAAGNLISSNKYQGIILAGGTSNCTIQNNRIGLSAAGAPIFGNAGEGILVQNATSNPVGNRISQNRIAGNGRLGIDLGGTNLLGDGPTPNDNLDPDLIPNNGQNFPVIESVSGNLISGTLNSYASEDFRIEVFTSDAADLSGFGEGQTFVGATTVVTNAAGNASWSVNAPSNLTGKFVSATAIYVSDTGTVGGGGLARDGDTSEFSKAFAVNAPAINTTTTLASSLNPSQVGQNVIFTATVAPASGNAKPTGTVTFKDGTTTRGTATLSASGVATFSTSTLSVGTHPITAIYSGSRAFNGSTSAVLNQVVSAAPVLPTLSIGDVSLAEGNSGTKTANFTVTLSGNQTSAVTVKFITRNGTATAGSDFVAQSGTLRFPNLTASGKKQAKSTQTIAITVNGDTAREGNETFAVSLSNPSGATLSDAQGAGTILNDDRASDLQITQSVSPNPVPVGATAIFTLQITNNGPDAAQNVVVSDTLPANAVFVSAQGATFTRNGGVVTFALGALENGATRTLSVTLRAPDSAQNLLNSAGVSGDGAPDSNTGNNQSTGSVQTIAGPQNVTGQTGISVSKLVNVGPYTPNLYRAGAHLVQTVSIRNTGSSAIGGPVYLILDGLPAGAELSNRSGFTTLETAGQNFIVLNVGSDGVLSAGETVKVRLEFRLRRGVRPAFNARVVAGAGTP